MTSSEGSNISLSDIDATPDMQYNFLTEIKSNMCGVKPHSWKELVE